MKNKEITIYELMGLIKDNKAPKKIKCNDINYQTDEFEWFISKMFELNHLEKVLNTKVEILPEENDEWEDIEDITLNGKTIGYGILNEWLDFSINNNEQKICSCIETLGIAMNKLIKNQKYLKERLDKDE